MSLAPHLRTGREGENAAELFLRNKGWRILARNWRQGRLELDLICRDRDSIVFVEVKTRKADGLTRPDEAFTPRKQQNVVRAAQAWLNENQAWDQPCRFDLANVSHTGETCEVELISNVIELGPGSGLSVGGGYASWQPW